MEEATHKDDVKVLRIPHQRLVYELLEDVTREWSGFLEQGYRKFVIDMNAVTFMDSASIGALMDFYRKTKGVHGRIYLAAVQPRIETLLAIAKAKNLFGIYGSVDDAVAGMQES